MRRGCHRESINSGSSARSTPFRRPSMTSLYRALPHQNKMGRRNPSAIMELGDKRKRPTGKTKRPGEREFDSATLFAYGERTTRYHMAKQGPRRNHEHVSDPYYIYEMQTERTKLSAEKSENTGENRNRREPTNLKKQHAREIPNFK